MSLFKYYFLTTKLSAIRWANSIISTPISQTYELVNENYNEKDNLNSNSSLQIPSILFAVPKRKRSLMKRRVRWASMKLKPLENIKFCTVCQKPQLFHHYCSDCPSDKLEADKRSRYILLREQQKEKEKENQKKESEEKAKEEREERERE